jgi:hypothetical protein
MKSWIKHKEPDPANEDATPGWVVQEIEGDSGTDYETPGRMHARAETDGHQLGAARVPKEEAVGTSSGARGWIAGGSRARIGMARAAALAARTTALKRVKALPARQAANAAARSSGKERTQRLRKDALPSAREREEKQKTFLNELRQRYVLLSRDEKGYFSHVAVLVGIEAGVVAFDGGALYGALQRAGFSGAVLIYVMIAVPILIAAVNHGLGLLAGAIGLKLAGSTRLKAAIGAFAATLGCLVFALILLAVFRGEATSAQNAVITAWAKGGLGTGPNLLISPSWLGPAQIAGSGASIIAVALWTLAGEGRELRSEIGRAEGLVNQREAERIEVEAEIERGHETDATLAVAAAEMKAAAAEAQVEVDAHADSLKASVETEEGLEEAAAGRLTTSYVYTNQVYRNGGIVRVAFATVTRLGRRFTPSPGDTEGQPRHEASTNGHRPTSADELSSLIKD